MVLIFVRFVFGGFLVLKACCCTRKLEGGAATLEWEKIKNDNPWSGVLDILNLLHTNNSVLSSPDSFLTNPILHCRHSAYTQGGPQPTTGIADVGNRSGSQGTQAFEVSHGITFGDTCYRDCVLCDFTQSSRQTLGCPRRIFVGNVTEGRIFSQYLAIYPRQHHSTTPTFIHSFQFTVCDLTLEYTRIMNKY